MPSTSRIFSTAPTGSDPDEGHTRHWTKWGGSSALCTRPTGWILELDITSYFDTIVREQLIEMIEKRISDDSVLRLIRKWIQAGVIEEGRLLMSETGTGQGQPISPMLANIYLNYILDKWFEEVVKPRMKGEAHEIRFADDGAPRRREGGFMN